MTNERRAELMRAMQGEPDDQALLFIVGWGAPEITCGEMRSLLTSAPSAPQGWQPIESAPRDQDEHGLTPRIILGFAADEERYSPESREGLWSPVLNRWVSTLDPCWGDCPQPTHWMPLPVSPVAQPASQEEPTPPSDPDGMYALGLKDGQRGQVWCKVRRAGKTDPPQDCDWPWCGCDPHADRVIAHLQECNMLVAGDDGDTTPYNCFDPAHVPAPSDSSEWEDSTQPYPQRFREPAPVSQEEPTQATSAGLVAQLREIVDTACLDYQPNPVLFGLHCLACGQTPEMHTVRRAVDALGALSYSAAQPSDVTAEAARAWWEADKRALEAEAEVERVKALSSSAPVERPPQLPQTEETQFWAVSVSRNGENLVTIETNCLSGKPEFSDEDKRVIRMAAEHLRAFIGVERGPEDEPFIPCDHDYVWVQETVLNRTQYRCDICGHVKWESAPAETQEARADDPWPHPCRACGGFGGHESGCLGDGASIPAQVERLQHRVERVAFWLGEALSFISRLDLDVATRLSIKELRDALAEAQPSPETPAKET